MLRRTSNSLLLAVVVLATTAAPGFGQLGRPKADVTTLVESDGVRAGTSVRLALNVVLPDTLHVQSDAPRDPLLIPTLLTIDPPEGVVVEAIVYPEPIDFEQVGQDEPLAVFSHDFTIGVQVAIAAGVAPGDLVIPARLRYQACDEHMCFPPATVDTPWTLRVVPAARSVAVQHADVFQRIGSGREGAPRAQAPAASTAPTTADLRPATPGEGRSELDALGRFTMLGTTGGYLGSADFLQFIGNAERGVEPRGLLEGRGLAAMLLIVFLGGLALNLTPCVLPMIPINIAIIGAGVRAGSRVRGFLLGSTYGSAGLGSSCGTRRDAGDAGGAVVAPTQRYGHLAGGATAAPDEEARYIGQVWETAYGALNGVPAALDESNHQRYGVSSTPTIVLVDRDGIVRLYHPGQMTEEALEPIVRQWVAGD